MPSRSGVTSILWGLKSFALLVFCAFGAYALTRYAREIHAETDNPPRRIDFNRDIRPILADKCWVCHGPDAPNKQIKLRLDSEEGALADLGRGRRAIVPNHPEQSQLVRRITAEDEAMRMPPVDSGRALTKQQIELLTEWIRQGAEWKMHWSFIAPAKPQLPQVKNGSWPK
ncbi:MAG: c-type cytochrome domain-containing protein, partial [Blastocatellia bacterium]